eukprot:scaffold131158_cov18-Prasinocladus_malaysianus.AAC.1
MSNLSWTLPIAICCGGTVLAAVLVAVAVLSRPAQAPDKTSRTKYECGDPNLDMESLDRTG